jgi:hypothetical protein
MSNMKSNAQLDRQIAQANDPASLRQLLHNHLEAAGMIAHENGNGEAYVVQHPTAPAAAPALPNRENFSASARRTIYPYGNVRLEISGVNEESLDVIEERIKQAFQN